MTYNLGVNTFKMHNVYIVKGCENAKEKTKSKCFYGMT